MRRAIWPVIAEAGRVGAAGQGAREVMIRSVVARRGCAGPQ
jgi:hypothetical protein